MTYIDPMLTPPVNPEVEAVMQEAVTERSEDDNETRLEIIETEAERDIRLAEIAAAAAVEIAEVQAEALEVDDQWLASQFAAVADVLARMETRLDQLILDVQTIAVAILASSTLSTLTPPTPEPPTPEVIPPEPEPEPASAPAAKRARRLF